MDLPQHDISLRFSVPSGSPRQNRPPFSRVRTQNRIVAAAREQILIAICSRVFFVRGQKNGHGRSRALLGIPQVT